VAAHTTPQQAAESLLGTFKRGRAAGAGAAGGGMPVDSLGTDRYPRAETNGNPAAYSLMETKRCEVNSCGPPRLHDVSPAVASVLHLRRVPAHRGVNRE
jgi:hypothetical protein